MKLIRMLLGTTGFLMLFLGAHFHFVDKVVCDKASVELTLEFARLLKLDKAYDGVRDRLNPGENDAETGNDSLEDIADDAEDAIDAAAEEADQYVNDWNHRVSERQDEAESIVEGEAIVEEIAEEMSSPPRWSGLVQREDVYEWTPPGPLSGFLIAFGLVISVMNIATGTKR